MPYLLPYLLPYTHPLPYTHTLTHRPAIARRAHPHLSGAQLELRLHRLLIQRETLTGEDRVDRQVELDLRRGGGGGAAAGWRVAVTRHHPTMWSTCDPW